MIERPSSQLLSGGDGRVRARAIVPPARAPIRPLLTSTIKPSCTLRAASATCCSHRKMCRRMPRGAITPGIVRFDISHGNRSAAHCAGAGRWIMRIRRPAARMWSSGRRIGEKSRARMRAHSVTAIEAHRANLARGSRPALAATLLAAAAAAWLTLRASLPAIDGRRRCPDSRRAYRSSAMRPASRPSRRRAAADLARGVGLRSRSGSLFSDGSLAPRRGRRTVGTPRAGAAARRSANCGCIDFARWRAPSLAGLDAPSRALLDAYVEPASMRACPRCAAGRSNTGCCRASRSRGAPRTACCACTRCSCSCRTPPGMGSCSAACCARRCPSRYGAFWRRARPNGTRRSTAAAAPSRGFRAPANSICARCKDLPVAAAAEIVDGELDLPGSNNWAVAGSRTPHGAALVANDMHLDFRVPNIWYRARLVRVDREPLDLTGVTLPGTPSHRRGQQSRASPGASPTATASSQPSSGSCRWRAIRTRTQPPAVRADLRYCRRGDRGRAARPPSTFEWR